MNGVLKGILGIQTVAHTRIYRDTKPHMFTYTCVYIYIHILGAFPQ